MILTIGFLPEGFLDGGFDLRELSLRSRIDIEALYEHLGAGLKASVEFDVLALGFVTLIQKVDVLPSEFVHHALGDSAGVLFVLQRVSCGGKIDFEGFDVLSHRGGVSRQSRRLLDLR
jgi:hypothetical protein